MDIIELIFKSGIIQGIAKSIKDVLMSLVKDTNIYLLLWVAVSVGIAMFLSGKTITKTVHIISFSILIILGLKYIGIL